MSALKSLQFVSVPKSFSNDPMLGRRHKLVTQLEQQLALAIDENFVVRRQRWVKQEDGSKQLVDMPKRVNASSHSGRRTFLTGLAHKGVNVRVLAALAGHKNISTTQRYIEVGEHQLRAAVEMV